jgi:hypothetical protein
VFLVQLQRGPSPPEIAQQDAAQATFSKLAGHPTAESQEQVTIGGHPGWELTGTGREHGREVKVYAAFVFTDHGTVSAVGFDPVGVPDQTEAFRAMAHSLKLRG